MSWQEIFGFLFSVIALIFMAIKSIADEKKRLKDDQSERRESEDQDQVLKDFLGSLDMDMKEAKKIEKRKTLERPSKQVQQPKKQSHRLIKDTYKLESKIENKQLATKVDKRELTTSIEDRFYNIKDEITSSDFSSSTDDPYSLKEKNEIPIIRKIMSKLPASRDLLVYQIVMGKPKGLENRIDSHDYK
jgi:hypothetical protein